MMVAQHRQNIEDPAVALGTVTHIFVTTAMLALSVWLLLSNYHSTNQGLYLLYTVIAVAGPILAFYVGGIIKRWISAYGTKPRIEENTGFFGERICDSSYESDEVYSVRS